jgi:type III secretory pathway component EscT
MRNWRKKSCRVSLAQVGLSMHLEQHLMALRDVSHQKDANVAIALQLRLCNTSEMTLGRVLGFALGILFDFE